MMDDSDCLMECPYNMSHRVQKSRMQTHLFKCRKVVKNEGEMKEMVRCPFSANHDVPRAELTHHMELCSYRGSVQTHLAQTVSERTPVIMAYVAPVLPSEGENWDCDEPAQTYDPTARNMSHRVLRALQGASKSERKHHRLQERLRFTAVAENGGLEGAVGGYDENCNTPIQEEKHAYKYNQEVRQPKTKSRTFAIPLAAVAKPPKAEKNENVQRGNVVQAPAPPFDMALARSPERAPATAIGGHSTGAIKKTTVAGGAKASGPEKTSRVQAPQRYEPVRPPHSTPVPTAPNDIFTRPMQAAPVPTTTNDRFARPMQAAPVPTTTNNRVAFSVDTGAGVPVPNLERDFPALGRGRGRLREARK